MWNDLEPREQAENMVNYFARIAEDNDSEVWRRGLITAKEWQRLVDSEDWSEAEISSLLGVVHANRHRSSGWGILTGQVYTWAHLIGHPVPPEEEFFAAASIFSIIRDVYEMPSIAQARELLSIFQKYNREDPGSELWKPGIEITQNWLTLIEAEEVNKTAVAKLMDALVLNVRKFGSYEWIGTGIGIGHWCKTIGFADLIPDELRHIVD